MNIPYGTIITDREPFVLIEKSKISINKGSVIATNKNGVMNIPISSIHMLMLGYGCSITSEASILCAKHNCFISFVKGGCNSHSIWHSGRYSNPKTLMAQCILSSDPIRRLEVAKKLMNKRISYLEEYIDIKSHLLQIENCKTIEQILGLEGAITRKVYNINASKNNINFKRDQLSKNSGPNSNLTILNNCLYSFVTSILVSLGYSPSVGFIHGQTRRGGLTFDIADIFKSPLYIKEAFDPN